MIVNFILNLKIFCIHKNNFYPEKMKFLYDFHWKNQHQNISNVSIIYEKKNEVIKKQILINEKMRDLGN